MRRQPESTQSKPTLVVAIDGPAGAGKSTVARQLARRLGFEFLDTGAMYRCVTLAVLRADQPLDDEQAVLAIAQQLNIEFDGSRVWMNGEDVSQAIRTPEVASAIGKIADNVHVRRILSHLQRQWTEGRQVVTEGRDQGSEVFHDSPCKIFLVASSQERARRRQQELAERGIDLSLEEVLRQQDQRDAEDQARAVGGLRQAEDAIVFCTDGMSLAQVVDELHQLVARQLSGRATVAGLSTDGESA